MEVGTQNYAKGTQKVGVTMSILKLYVAAGAFQNINPLPGLLKMQ